MKSLTFILAMFLAASAWAQDARPAAGQQPAPAKPSAVAPTSAPAKPSAAPVTPSSAAKPGAKAGNRRPAHKIMRRASKAPAAKAPGAPASGGRMAVNKRGERDPFVSPIMERSRSAAACNGSGRQCLIVGEITLNGVVRSPSGYIAVVVNGPHTYFLRDNDPLADGEVEKITQDSITMRQRTFDVYGKPVTREVTRKLGVPAV
jgi:hypothetical protein